MPEMWKDVPQKRKTTIMAWLCYFSMNLLTFYLMKRKTIILVHMRVSDNFEINMLCTVFCLSNNPVAIFPVTIPFTEATHGRRYVLSEIRLIADLSKYHSSYLSISLGPNPVWLSLKKGKCRFQCWLSKQTSFLLYLSS